MEECFFDKVLSSGKIVLTINGITRQISLIGILIPPHKTQATHSFLSERIADIPLRCKVNDTGTQNLALVEYLAWRDKSGEVWKELGETLVEQNLAERVIKN